MVVLKVDFFSALIFILCKILHQVFCRVFIKLNLLHLHNARGHFYFSFLLLFPSHTGLLIDLKTTSWMALHVSLPNSPYFMKTRLYPLCFIGLFFKNRCLFCNSNLFSIILFHGIKPSYHMYFPSSSLLYQLSFTFILLLPHLFFKF